LFDADLDALAERLDEGKRNEQPRGFGTMNCLERALKHLGKLPENGLLVAIDKRIEKYELIRN
jgi:hypothetical protein